MCLTLMTFSGLVNFGSTFADESMYEIRLCVMDYVVSSSSLLVVVVEVITRLSLWHNMKDHGRTMAHLHK